jgi:hypothetical protein
MAAAGAYMGDTTGAKAHADEVLKRAPDFTVTGFLTTLHYLRAEDSAH